MVTRWVTSQLKSGWHRGGVGSLRGWKTSERECNREGAKGEVGPVKGIGRLIVALPRITGFRSSGVS